MILTDSFTEGHINTSPGIVSYDIPYSDAMGYDLVKLKHFDMREIYVGKYHVAQNASNP